IDPDAVILDWQMPHMSGADFIRFVRSPDSFPLPNVPIIVLTGHGERQCVIDAMQLGANEYLLKPVSTKALFDRLISVLSRPRAMIRSGKYYGPQPRKAANEVSRVESELIYAEVTCGERQDDEKSDNHDDVVMI